MTTVKICGISQLEHAAAAVNAGADMLGFIFYPTSSRYVDPERVREILAECRQRNPGGWRAVGVFVNEPLDKVNSILEGAGLDLAQLAGDESPEYCRGVGRPVIKVVRVRDGGDPTECLEPDFWRAERILLDTHRPSRYGGTGERLDWRGVRPVAQRALLAGGLSPGNVAEAIELAQPWGVDVSSGVEQDGQKSVELIHQFVAEVKAHVPTS